MSGEKHSRQKEQPVQRPQGSRGVSGTFKGQRGSRCDGRKGGHGEQGLKIPRTVLTLQISCAFVLNCCYDVAKIHSCLHLIPQDALVC